MRQTIKLTPVYLGRESKDAVNFTYGGEWYSVPTEHLHSIVRPPNVRDPVTIEVSESWAVNQGLL